MSDVRNQFDTLRADVKALHSRAKNLHPEIPQGAMAEYNQVLCLLQSAAKWSLDLLEKVEEVGQQPEDER